MDKQGQSISVRSGEHAAYHPGGRTRWRPTPAAPPRIAAPVGIAPAPTAPDAHQQPQGAKAGILAWYGAVYFAAAPCYTLLP